MPAIRQRFLDKWFIQNHVHKLCNPSRRWKEFEVFKVFTNAVAFGDHQIVQGLSAARKRGKPGVSQTKLDGFMACSFSDTFVYSICSMLTYNSYLAAKLHYCPCSLSGLIQNASRFVSPNEAERLRIFHCRSIAVNLLLLISEMPKLERERPPITL